MSYTIEVPAGQVTSVMTAATTAKGSSVAIGTRMMLLNKSPYEGWLNEAASQPSAAAMTANGLLMREAGKRNDAYSYQDSSTELWIYSANKIYVTVQEY